ncbi:MAG: DUF2812 domain-containing protein [Eubacteriaceae bacterium]|nr:DUF2812 domain-containing protein [Eubacteriaceae bacterium]
MKDTKRFFPIFAFYDRTGIENYLEEKAGSGWMLEKIANFGWVFRRCEPKKVNFAVTYFPKASAFDPEPTEEQLTFNEFCEHTGWIFAAQNAQMQIYYNESENPTPIETDALIELENIHKSAKKSHLPTYYIFLTNGILHALTFFQRWVNDPADVLTSNVNLFNGLCWILILMMSLSEIGAYYSWRRKALRVAKDNGEFVRTSSCQGFQLFILAVMLTGLSLMISSLHNAALFGTLIAMLFGITAITILIIFISNCLKKMKVSKSVNGFITFGGSILLGIILSVSVVYIIASGTGSLGHDPVSTYEFGIFEIEVYDDPIPLKIEDMQEVSYDRYSYELWHQSSFLAEKYDCVQEPHISDSDEVPSLRYTVYEVKFSPVYNLMAEKIFEDILDSYTNDGEIIASLIPVDPTDFLAKDAYRVYYRETEPMNRYLVFYPNNIIILRTDNELSSKDMNVIGQKLGADIK